MSERRKIFELFETNKEMIDEKVSSGIEKYRKGDCSVRIVDENGAPVTGASVKIKQKSHEFRFGANIFLLSDILCLLGIVCKLGVSVLLFL